MSNTTEDPKRSDPESYGRIAELARDVQRARGLTEEQIDALLKRARAPENLRADDTHR
jgi:hypothetical protein